MLGTGNGDVPKVVRAPGVFGKHSQGCPGWELDWMILVGISSSGYSVIHCLHRCQAISTRSCRMSGSTSIPASPKSPASSYLTPASKSPPTPISMENSKVQRQSSGFYPDSLKPWQTVLLVPETPMSICHEKTSGREVGSSSQLCSPPSLLLPNAADRHGGRS